MLNVQLNTPGTETGDTFAASDKMATMTDPFELPVSFKGEELLFPAQLQQLGYVHRFAVDVYGQEVFFEPDEEQNYRAIVDPEEISQQISIELLKAIADAIGDVLK